MTAIKPQLKQAISDVTAKSSEVSAGEFAHTMAAQKVSQAQSIIGIKEGVVNAREKELDVILQKLSPPPTKEVSEGGKNGGTKTVVDTEEVKKLETQKASLQTQLTQAKAEVADARQEAMNATTEALDKAGISKAKQSEMTSLMDRINSIQDSLADGKPVKDEDIAKLMRDFKTISDGLTKEQNKAGLISKAFYDPVKRGFDNILKSLDKGSAASSTTTPASSSTTTPASSSTTTPAASSTTTPAASSTTTPAASSTTTPAASSTTTPAASSTSTPAASATANTDPGLATTPIGAGVAG